VVGLPEVRLASARSRPVGWLGVGPQLLLHLREKTRWAKWEGGPARLGYGGVHWEKSIGENDFDEMDVHTLFLLREAVGTRRFQMC